MKKGLLNIDWNNIASFSSDDISYFLFLEGKSIETISLIRNMDKGIIQNGIINGKIKYRLLARANNSPELFQTISMAGKDDKLQLLKDLDEENKNGLVSFIKESYQAFPIKEKETAVWMLGELKKQDCYDILAKASVNKSVTLRRMAVSALGKMEDIRVESILLRALEDDNPQVIQYAIKALQRVKSIKGKERINEIINSSDKDYLKRAAEEYILGI
ncbi:MAG: HEAT repeat domain-containing protein [Clostridiaceae bacterium]|nr:HEAT repeat domain-containing protein [Clostridiaceae bacterium]